MANTDRTSNQGGQGQGNKPGKGGDQKAAGEAVKGGGDNQQPSHP